MNVLPNKHNPDHWTEPISVRHGFYAKWRNRFIELLIGVTVCTRELNLGLASQLVCRLPAQMTDEPATEITRTGFRCGDLLPKRIDDVVICRLIITVYSDESYVFNDYVSIINVRDYVWPKTLT